MHLLHLILSAYHLGDVSQGIISLDMKNYFSKASKSGKGQNRFYL